MYGGHTRPNHTALSYTWGIWRLGEGDDPFVKALPVQGVTWELPCVHSAHFTVEEFEKAIRAFYQPYNLTGCRVSLSRQTLVLTAPAKRHLS